MASSSSTTNGSSGADASGSTRSTLMNLSNADLSRAVQKPIMSAESKVFWKEPYKLSGTRLNVARPSKDDGKLAQLMDMPMDIFLEVMALLHPQDLLNISRVSKYFRKILMHRSSKGMWAAARKNANNMPSPPDVLSEPKYASVLFERECQACDISRAGKVNFAMCLRLCSACWKENVFTRFQLCREYKALKPIIDTLLPLLPAHTTGTGPRAKESYYYAELEAVADRYMSLSGAERERFVEDRLAYVKVMQEHAQAVVEWQNRVWDERHDKEVSAVTKRKQSIYDRLLAMGYTEDQFPDPQSNSEWESLVYQPRELTERIWSQILPKLECCIEEEAEWRAEAAFNARWKEREAEVCSHLHDYLAELPASHPVLIPPYLEFMATKELKDMLKEDDANTPVTRERFDALVPSLLVKYSDRVLPRYITALQSALHPELSEEEVDALPFPDLDSALALFPCRHCSEYPITNNYTFRELNAHMKEVHWRPSEMHFWTSTGLDRKRFCVDTARKVLKMLGLPEDTRYDDVSKKVVCLCGKYGFEQPATFSALIRHIQTEREWHDGRVKSLQKSPQTEELKLYNDHDFDGTTPFLKVLEENETYTPPEIVVPEGITIPPAGAWCASCGKWAHTRFQDAREYAWHVRAKHHEEPTAEGLIPGPY